MAGKIRVYELARELGLSNKETLDLCEGLGIGVKSHSSSIVDAQADRVRRKADAEGLRRDPIEEPATSDGPTGAAGAEQTTEAPAAAAPPEPARAEATETAEPAQAPAATADEPDAPAGDGPAADRPAAGPRPGHRIVTSGKASEQPDVMSMPRPGAPRRTEAPPPRPEAPAARPEAPAARTGGEAPGARQGTVPPPPPGAGRPPGRPAPPAPPRSPGSGKPIPPPPGTAGGKRIPPPPGVGNRPSRGSSGGPGGGGGGGGGGGAPSRGRPPGGGGGRFAAPPGPPPLRPGQVPGAGGRGRPGPARRPRRGGGRRRRPREELQPQGVPTYTPEDAPVPEGEVVIERGATPKDLGPKLNRSAADVVRFLLQQGEMVTATQTLSDDMIELFAAEIGASVRMVDPGQEQELELQEMLDIPDDEDDEADLRPRPPIITVMGHVDHGKTLLLDRIRESNVVEGEAGGITQHIGAYQVEREGRLLTFIDTPGHEAFTAMRARGADVTDIVVLVVAADDGVMPTTLEALAHARAADVPIVVAINKIDRESADQNRVMQQLAEHDLVPESWGGETVTIPISALTGEGIDNLLDNLVVVAEVGELVANPEGRARGIVLESNLDVGRGPVSTVLVERGTLRVGDPIVAGHAHGKVRALIDDKGEHVKEAGPSQPVQILGLSEVADAGDDFVVAPDEKTARQVGETRAQYNRIKNIAADASAITTGVKLEDIFEQIQKGEAATLNVVLKADVMGSMEALSEALRKLEREDVKIVFVHRAVGGITENDVQLASATDALIIGFNVRPDRKARELAESEGVEIRTYEIIYQVLEDIENAMVGLLAPEFEEVVTGDAEVREIFSTPGGKVAGCYVLNGTITRNSKVRYLRDGAIIWKGTLPSLRRFKDDVREVNAGFECGIKLSDFQDLRQGDIIETFEEREIPRT